MPSPYSPEMSHPSAYDAPLPSLYEGAAVGQSIYEQPPRYTSEPPATTSSGGAVRSPTPRTQTRTPPLTVPAACLACRGKHLKCDGQSPCSRCKSSKSECVYVASRRGYKGPRRNAIANSNKRRASQSPPSFASVSSGYTPSPEAGAVQPADRHSHHQQHSGALFLHSSAPEVAMAPYNPAFMMPEAPLGSPYAQPPPPMASYPVYRHPYMPAVVEVDGPVMDPHMAPWSQQHHQHQHQQQHEPQQQQHPHSPPSLPERCLDSFYLNFYPGHPSVLPKAHLLETAKDQDLTHLLAAMRWAGSMYIDAAASDALDAPHHHPKADAAALSTAFRAHLLDDAMRLAYSPHVARDGFLVQALVILVVTLDGCCENDRAAAVLADAEQVALDIGLYTGAFAELHSGGSRLLEESWRRTWWDLYVVDGMIAGVHRQTAFMLFDVMASAALPCEERQYQMNNIPEPKQFLEEFEDYMFVGDTQAPFSSFAYRVAAIRNLGRMMRMLPPPPPPSCDESNNSESGDSNLTAAPPQQQPDEESVERIEAMLAVWRMHLPPSKRSCIDPADPSGFDEMMFQAHMITHACAINLHQPLSQLDTTPVRHVNACAEQPEPPRHRGNDSSDDRWNVHTRHVVRAAAEISKLVAGQGGASATSHTHFFTCLVTLASIVHLSKWASDFPTATTTTFASSSLSRVGQRDEGTDTELRQSIRLCLGALGQLSYVWRAAGRAAAQVRGVAADIYRAKRIEQSGPGYWGLPPRTTLPLCWPLTTASFASLAAVVQ